MARSTRFPLRRCVRSFFARTLGGVALASAGLAGAVLLEACGAESSDSTSGRRVVLHTRVEAADDASEFETAAGWSVKLDRALLSVGPLYYFDGVPPLALRFQERTREWAQRWLGLSVARAHPGHYQAGNALGQMLESSSVDLLDGPVSLAEGDGVTGTYRSARFSFLAAPAGPFADELGSHVALVEGVAEKDGEEPRVFRAMAELADVEPSAAEGHVDGCVLEEVTVESDGTVTVVVTPRVWFNLVDFSVLEPGSKEEPTEFPDGSQPKVAFAQGLAQLSAYRFSYQPD
jgi:hypothetical protein